MSKSTTLHGMFEGALFFNQDVGRWNVEKVTDLSGLRSSALGRLQELQQDDELQSVLEQVRGSLRRSIERFFSALTERPVHGALAETGAVLSFGGGGFRQSFGLH